jgi:outer membrane PBP1 activator LpoA protein
MIQNSKHIRVIAKPFFHLSSSTISAAVTLVMASVLLVACASTPPPTQQITAAEVAIAHAEQAQVADYASPELGEAREKLTAARAAVVKEDMKTAKRLAEQSALDADLATAKLNAAKAKTVNDEMLKSTSVIKQEMQRNPGVQ